MLKLYQVFKTKKVKNLTDHSDLDLASFEATIFKHHLISSMAGPKGKINA